jgi:hypothetical protein
LSVHAISPGYGALMPFIGRSVAGATAGSAGQALRSRALVLELLAEKDAGGCVQRFFLPVLRRNRSVTVVRGEVFARLLLTKRPVTADRTRVK